MGSTNPMPTNHYHFNLSVAMYFPNQQVLIIQQHHVESLCIFLMLKSGPHTQKSWEPVP